MTKKVSHDEIGMQPCSSVAELVTTPFGKYMRGNTFIVWCLTKDLGGLIVWGCPNADDVAFAMRMFEFERRLPGFRTLMDFSRLERVDLGAFEQAVVAARHRVASFDPEARRAEAIVCPSGVLGAVIAGIHSLAGAKHRWGLFETEIQALSWLGSSDALEIATSLRDMVDRAIGIPPTLGRLRDWIAGHLDHASLDGAAKGLLASRRSLQRSLSQAGSSFRAEVDRARLQEATRLLQETDLKIHLIAERTGCTEAGLSKLFARGIAKSPSAVRRDR
jgi:AraC-like DNA-binding protein